MFNPETINEEAEILEEDIREKRLTDDELAAYHSNAVDEVDRARIEGQLARDPLARRRYEIMKEVLGTYKETPLSTANETWLLRRLAQLKKGRSTETEEPSVASRIGEGLDELAQWLFPRLPQLFPNGARASGGKKRYSERGESQDGVLSWRGWEKPSGERVISIASNHTEGEGTLIAVEIGELRKEATFKLGRFKQISATVQFTVQEINSLPRNPRVKIYPVSNAT